MDEALFDGITNSKNDPSGLPSSLCGCTLQSSDGTGVGLINGFQRFDSLKSFTYLYPNSPHGTSSRYIMWVDVSWVLLPDNQVTYLDSHAQAPPKSVQRGDYWHFDSVGTSRASGTWIDSSWWKRRVNASKNLSRQSTRREGDRRLHWPACQRKTSATQ